MTVTNILPILKNNPARSGKRFTFLSQHLATSMKRKHARFVSLLILPLFILLLNVRCQYDYASPLPGLIDIRLHTVSDAGRIPFTLLNNFVIKITQVNALRSDLAQAPVFGDVQALKRTTGIYNTLDAHAEDSSLVLGQALLPPGDYRGVLMLIQPGGSVVLDGYRIIPVITLPDFDPTLSFLKSFKISEQRTTRIVLTINLDSTLVKQSDTFLFKPYYYISSIQYR